MSRNKHFKPEEMDFKFGRGYYVAVRGDDLNGAMRKLKKRLLEDRVMQELRDREGFIPPGEQRRRAKKQGIARHKKLRRDALIRDGLMNPDLIPGRKKKKRDRKGLKNNLD